MQIANIGKKQRITRGAMGAALLLAYLYLAIFYVQEFTLLWLAGLFVLVYNGVFLLFEARTGVCPVNAYREKQSMTGYLSIGKEDLQDKTLIVGFKEISRKNAFESLLVTLFLILPLLFI